ncbi:MAG: HipA N-terminal domain-containing protein, partial [Rickettsiales bacterium]|nr:HipA N-terminal domain-containing protein [Rickettsiales bacterium]
MKNKFVSVIYDKRKVGELALTKDGVCAFQYSPEWLANGFSISPIQLPLENKVFIAKQDPFDGNFGVFNDSLPDGWGRLLTDRLLKKQGIDPATVSVIDRLAIVGNTGAGALEYIPSEPLTNTEVLDSLDVLAREAEKILNEEQSGKLEELVRAGGSSG